LLVAIREATGSSIIREAPPLLGSSILVGESAIVSPEFTISTSVMAQFGDALDITTRAARIVKVALA
jgi:hypothetical protein